MPLAFIMGIPTKATERIGGAQRADLCHFRQGWIIKYFPATKHQTRPFCFNIDALLRNILPTLQEEGPHLLSFKPQNNEPLSKKIRNEIAPFFRVRWLDNSWMNLLYSDVCSLVAKMNQILREEELWRISVKPVNEKSPLLLPVKIFRTHKDMQSLWDLAAQGGTERIHAAEKKIMQFPAYHETKESNGRKAWKDDGNRIFGLHGPRHASAPFPFSWKYSFHIPDGFHFDVHMQGNLSFALNDHLGIAHKAEAHSYLNVSPHGHIR
jgi:hypothetical protein